jgi:hypothetical protein
MFAKIGDLTSSIISSEKNLPLAVIYTVKLGNKELFGHRKIVP